MEDITPKYPILSADQEIIIPQAPSDGQVGQTIGGFTATPTGLSSGNIQINSAGQQIMLGLATSPTAGIGIFMGSDQQATVGYDFRVGDPSGSYLWWDASANSLFIKGAISASSIDIPDTSTANSFHADSSGNTWWGATTLAASTASVTKDGIATFAGLSSINMKAFTDFETAGRFISTLGGTGSTTFGNQGVTVAPGATGTSYARLLWWITQYVFNNTPTFTCSMLALGGFTAGDGRAYIGLGAPTIDGSAIAVINRNYAGFLFVKTSGVTTLTASQCDGSGSRASANIVTITNNDSLELFIKVGTASIKYYYRLNGGALTLGATLSTFLPSGGETYIMFGSTNSATANDFQVQLQCAAYEH